MILSFLMRTGKKEDSETSSTPQLFNYPGRVF
jgi:hypothetical protein